MSLLGLFLAIALVLILAGAVYLARQLEAKRRAALAAWAEAGGWTFTPGPEPVPSVARAPDPGAATPARYNAHQLFQAPVFGRAGAVHMHLFEQRPARGAERSTCLVAELGADLALTLPPPSDDVTTAQHGRTLLVRRAGPATAAIFGELAAIARALVTAAGAAQGS